MTVTRVKTQYNTDKRLKFGLSRSATVYRFSKCFKSHRLRMSFWTPCIQKSETARHAARDAPKFFRRHNSRPVIRLELVPIRR